MSDETRPSPVPDERGLIPGKNGGRIVAPWDSERGRAAVQVRMERAQKMARAALVKVAGSYAPEVEAAIAKSKAKAGYLAWGRVIQAQSEVALDPAAYGTTQAARFVGMSTGFLPAYASQVVGGEVGPGGITIHIDADAARMLLAELRAARAQAPAAVLGEGDKDRT